MGQTSSASSSRDRGDSANRRSRKKPKQEGTDGTGGGDGRLLEVESVACEIREDELHRLPGRLFLNGASETTCLHTQQGQKGPNQDAMIVWEVSVKIVFLHLLRSVVLGIECGRRGVFWLGIHVVLAPFE